MYRVFVRKFGSVFFDNTRIASAFRLCDLLIQNFAYKLGEKKGISGLIYFPKLKVMSTTGYAYAKIFVNK
jgi:hypothetical protein